ncbi:tetratricopeptide repeat protein [Streptomyces sp. TS71-3]|uniref:tetratricopeptide repeat protein n=1 Tax=Streptomyces sp. TS71-3 TaxID=2733862 RepID=UPI001B155F97|nr:tetratricopeptide repeat protein [Streptomyces sp. TS71-3]GHJ39814.1 hypothetical protein Sm713_54230 [Streptomyces sp. TS71-3]
MTRRGPSMHELIRRRRRAGFIGRQDELAAFRGNFDLPPEDDRHRFLFHVHGAAGVGKTFLVREMEQAARERGALTAYLDESVGSVPEALAAVGADLARQGRPLKALEKRLAAYRQKRQEAESLSLREAAEDGAPGGRPSAGSMAVARAGLTGLGLVPVVGAFAGALDPAEVAESADRLRAALGARFHDQGDVQLVLAPERALTPVLVDELSEADAPWIVLFFDTYERTGPFLDGWLRELMTTDRYGALPAHVVVVLAGQRPFDAVRWGGWADFVADLPLEAFSEAEARGLLAAKGITDETVVDEVLRLSGRLPLLVSMLAEGRPGSAEDVGDPSTTAVERFLKWEPDPVRRSAALACALPRRLDEDVFRAAVDEAAAGLYAWLCRLPFVSERGSRVRYHDVVREPMLRLQRQRSQREFAGRHARLAEAFGRWRAEAAAGVDVHRLWTHEPWRAYRLEETYHLLCARPVTELPAALKDTVEACGQGAPVGRLWARMLADAGQDVDDGALRRWGEELTAALAPGEDVGRAGATDTGGGVLAALDVLLARPGLEAAGRALAHAARGWELFAADDPDRALAEYDRAIELDAGLVSAYEGRSFLHLQRGADQAALDDIDRACALDPEDPDHFVSRGEIMRIIGSFGEAVEDFGRAIALDPTDARAYASRGVCQGKLGRADEEMADLDQALALDGEYLWALVRRSRAYGRRGEWEAAFADLDRAALLDADSAWIASERADAYRHAKRYEDALTELNRALSLDPDHVSALAGRGDVHAELGHHEEAIADLSSALEASPHYVFALIRRALVRDRLGDEEGAFDDLDRAVVAEPASPTPLWTRGLGHHRAGRYGEALADFDRALTADPDYVRALEARGRTLRFLGEFRSALRDMDRALELDPGNGGVLVERVLIGWETGRITPALADLDRLSGAEDDRLPVLAAGVLLAAGRGDEALRRLAHAPSGAEPDMLRSEAHRRAGRWAAARHFAVRACATDPLGGAHLLARAVAESEGPAPAAVLWRRVQAMAGVDADDFRGTWTEAVASYALGDWARADRCLGLAAFDDFVLDWYQLDGITHGLASLLRSPGADRPRLLPRLIHVAGARDAFQARYAQDPPD